MLKARSCHRNHWGPHGQNGNAVNCCQYSATLGSFAVAILVTGVFVGIIALTTHVRLSDVVVAFAPGAMDAMLALALTLHIDPIFVGAHHLSRFVFVSIATPGIVHLFGRTQDDVDD